LDPDGRIDTFMINKNLCHDGSSPSKKQRSPGDDDSGSPSKKDKQKRPKIISPRR
jgi:hypothetical protein